MPIDRDTDTIIGNMSKEEFEAWLELHRQQNDQLLALDRAPENYSELRVETLRLHEEEKVARLEQEWVKQQSLVEVAMRSQDDAARSQFAAQFAAEQQAGVAEAVRAEQEQTKSRFIAEDQQRQEQTAEAGRSAEDQDKSRFLAEDAQRQAETAKNVQVQQDQARQQDAADTLRAEQERGRSAAEAAEELGRSGVKPTFEQHVSADAAMFEKRREELRDSIEQEKAREIEATVGGIDDLEMATYVAQERERIAVEWDRREAERLAAIAREEQARLDRTCALYGRDD